MTILYVFISSFFFISVINNLLFWLQQLHESEYHFDIFISNFRKYHKDKLYYFILILKGLGLFAFIPAALDDRLSGYHLLVACIFLIDTIIFVNKIINKSLKIRAFTFREVFLCFASTTVVFLLYLNPITDYYFWFLFLERSFLFIVLFFVFASSFPIEIYEDFQIEKAKKIRATLANLFICITGEYAEAAVDYTQQLLRKKKTVIRLQDPVTNKAHLARLINKYIKNDRQICILHFEDNKKGAISTLAEYLRPQIGVITGVSRNRDIFRKREYDYLELIKSLPQGSSGICRLNNKLSQLVIKRAIKELHNKRIEPIFYETAVLNTDMKLNKNSVYTAPYNIKCSRKDILFDIILNQKLISLRTILIGEESLAALIPAIIIANYLDYSPDELVKYVSNIRPSKGYMFPYKHKNKTTIIDNSSLSSTGSLLSSLRYLQLYSGKKILVISSLNELTDIYPGIEQLFMQIANQSHYLFLLDKSSWATINKILSGYSHNCIVEYGNISQIAKRINQELQDKNDVALITGKTASRVIEVL